MILLLTLSQRLDLYGPTGGMARLNGLLRRRRPQRASATALRARPGDGEGRHL